MKNETPDSSKSNGQFTLPPLPFADTALAPTISAQTLSFHHGKHHKAYVDKVNALVKERSLPETSLLDLILSTHGNKEQTPVFNNAAQAWNHDFYWKCLTPGGGKAAEPKQGEELARLINDSFGDIQALKTELIKTAVAQFGSGWAWLVRDGSKLKVMSTSNAEVPFTAGYAPLLTLDVWEHAYYLDYQNRREAHVTAVVDQLLNWKFATENLARAGDFKSKAAAGPRA